LTGVFIILLKICGCIDLLSVFSYMSGVAAKAEQEVLQPPVNICRAVKFGRELLDLSP
jgi:hypothetical protein